MKPLEVVNNPLIQILSKKLDVALLRQRVISGNISNISTPGYRPLDVEFESHLREAMSRGNLKGVRTHERHLPIGSPSLADLSPTIHERRVEGGARADGPQIEDEMKSLAETQIEFMTSVKVLSGLFQSLRKVIRGRTV